MSENKPNTKQKKTKNPNPKKSIPEHPGAVLYSRYMEPKGMSQTQLAHAIDVNVLTINRVVNGKGRITSRMAHKLAAALGTKPEYWAVMQMHFDLYQAKKLLRKLPKRIAAN